jgi:hypothetical protein
LVESIGGFLEAQQDIEALKKCTPRILWKLYVTIYIEVQG